MLRSLLLSMPDQTAMVSEVSETPEDPRGKGEEKPFSLKYRVLRWLLVGAASVLILGIIWSTRTVLLPFAIGLVLVYLLLPIVNFLSRYIPRWGAILLSYLGVLLILVGMGAYIVPLLIVQVKQFMSSLPTFSVEDATAQLRNLFGHYEEIVPEAVRETLQEGIDKSLTQLKENVVSYAQEAGTFLFSGVLQIINTVLFLVGLVIIPVWMFYVINDYQAGIKKLDKMLPSWMRSDFWAVATIVNRLLENYIRGQFLLCLVVGLAVGIGLSMLRLFGFNIEYILMLAVIAGLTELIPIVGPYLGAIPAIFIAVFDSPSTVLAVVILYTIIQVVENNVLIPRIIGDSLGIHPVFMILLMIIASHLFGLIGIVLAAPVSAMARDVFFYVYRRLGGQPGPSYPDPFPSPPPSFSPAEPDVEPEPSQASPSEHA